MKLKSTALLLAVVLFNAVVLADPPEQQPVPKPVDKGPSGDALPQPPAPQPTVKSVATNRKAKPKALPEARLRENVFVTVDNYAELEKTATATTPVTLWINGRDSKLVAEEIVPTGASATLSFQLERTADDDNKNLWKTLLENPFKPNTRPITISVGVMGTQPIAGQKALTLIKTERGRAFWWFGALAVLVTAFCVLAWKTGIVRNGPRVQVGGVWKNQAYSLGRCQMAWWFFLILTGYVAIWLICGDQDTITTSLLALMGISAGTALGAVAIDRSSDSTARTKLIEEQMGLQKQLADTQAQITAAGGAAAPAAAGFVATEKQLNERLTEVTKKLGTPDIPALSEFWLLDLLRDDDGSIALHRFQIVVWTIVLGGMFLASVFSTLTMPQFSATLLTLMGISSGTYLGFKPSSS